MKQDITKTKLVIIGAGPGGYTAAFLAADLGVDVTLIDQEAKPGGVCLYRGCIPAKALLHTTKILQQTRNAHRWGVTYSKPDIKFPSLMSWKENVVQKLSRGLEQLTKKRNIRYIQGRARFLTPRTLEITSKTEQRFRQSCTHAIIATGARPRLLPGLDFSSPYVLDSSRALELDAIPSSLLVIGAGYIGLELGSFYAGMGGRVTLVEMLPDILAMADRDIVSVFLTESKDLFESILVNTMVRLEAHKNQIKALFYKTDDRKSIYSKKLFDSVLVTIGREPNSRNLGLENTAIKTDKKGFIKVNSRMRTDENNIYAIGDVSGAPLLAHKAAHQGITAVENIIGKNSFFTTNLIPVVEYTNPQIAWCGLTENQAKAQRREIRVIRFPWTASGRAATMDIHSGLTKLLIDPHDEKILGAAIVGSEAGELISEITLAIKLGATADDVRSTVHPHPSLSETVMQAAAAFYGLSTNIYDPKS